MRSLLVLVLLLAAGPAAAHTGHGPHGLADGFAHPFLGLDHLLAMLAVGVWGAMLGRRLLLLAPLAFLAAMAAGAAIAIGGMALPGIELGVAASLVLLGVLVADAFRLPAAASAALVASLGLLHGFAHGSELPAGASGALYAAGFLAATGLLHGLGAGAALLALGTGGRRALRFAGLAVAATGLWLAQPAFAAGGVEVQEAWARASAGAHRTGAAYLTLVNHGEAADRLVAASTPAAERAELHAHLHENGVMKMRQVEAVEVHLGEPTVLAPGGLHVMLVGLAKPLEEGARFPLTLRFEKAGERTVQVVVMKAGAAGPAGHAGSPGHKTH